MSATKNIDDLKHSNVLQFIFNGLFLSRSERLKFFIEQQQKYGNIYKIKLPARQLIVLTDPNWIKYVLVENNKNYTKSFAYDAIKIFLGNGLLTSEGEFWKRQRRLAQPAFHREKLNFMFQNMVEQTQKCIEQLEVAAQKGSSINLSKLLYRLTLDVVNSTLFYNEVNQTTDTIYQLVSEASIFISNRVDNPFQLPEWIPTPSRIKEKEILEKMDKVFYEVIDRRRNQPEEQHDLLSMLMDAKDEDTGEGMDNKQLRDEILTIFVAGHETTQISLGWTFYLLSQNPEKLAVLQNEIDNELKGKLPSPENCRNLKYLKQVIEESMRCFPPAWIMGRRSIGSDVIDGYEIPGMTNVVMPIYVVHHDENIWENPYDFIPERFAPENIKDKHKFAYFPFGGGPRLCIGNNFAIQEMQIALIMILQRFNVEVDSSFKPELEPLVTLRQKNEIYATVSKR